MTALRVLVLGDSPIFVRGVVAVLQATPRVGAVDAAHPRDDLDALLARHRPNVVVFIEGGAAGAADVVRRAGQVPVLVVGRATMSDIATAIRARASGYVGRDESAEHLVTTLLALAAGRSVYPSGWQDAIASVPSTRRGVDVELTPREQDIVRLVVAGSSNKEIARALGLAQQTVKNHLGHVMLKLGVSSRLQLYRWAVESGVVKGPDDRIVIDVREEAHDAADNERY